MTMDYDIKKIIDRRESRMYKLKECHSNKVLTDIFVEPTAIWTDTVRIGENLANCIVFVDSANNKYALYTKDKVFYDKLMDDLTNNMVFVSTDLVVMNESHFIDECSDIDDEEQVKLASDVMNYVMTHYNIYTED